MNLEIKYISAFLIVFFAISTFFSVLINWIFLRFSVNLGVRDTAGQIRWSSNVKPSIGGISFFIVFLISISVLGTLPRENAYWFDKQLIGIIASSSLGFLLGLADDAYNTNPLAKFITQLTCAFILIISGVYIHATGVLPVDYALTTMWVIGLMNSVNMLDNMDAITTTTSMSIIAAIICVISLSGFSSSTYYLVMLVGVLGSLAGFLFFNWSPAKIYMGDTGSQFLGVFLAATSMLFLWNFKNTDSTELIQLKQFVIPMLVFIVPLIDTTTVTIRRLLRKQSPFVGGRDHITHHLAYFGLSDRQVALTLLSISAVSVLFTVALIDGWVNWGWPVTIGAFAYTFAVFVILQVIYNVGAKRQAEKLAQSK